MTLYCIFSKPSHDGPQRGELIGIHASKRVAEQNARLLREEAYVKDGLLALTYYVEPRELLP